MGDAKRRKQQDPEFGRLKELLVEDALKPFVTELLESFRSRDTEQINTVLFHLRLTYDWETCLRLVRHVVENDSRAAEVYQKKREMLEAEQEVGQLLVGADPLSELICRELQGDEPRVLTVFGLDREDAMRRVPDGYNVLKVVEGMDSPGVGVVVVRE